MRFYDQITMPPPFKRSKTRRTLDFSDETGHGHVGKTGKTDNNDKDDKNDETGRVEKTDGNDRSDRNDKSDKNDKTDKSDKIDKSEAERRKELSAEEFEVCRKKGTERAFTGALVDNKEAGTYLCRCCDEELFASETKYESHSGWPSFYEPAAPG